MKRFAVIALFASVIYAQAPRPGVVPNNDEIRSILRHRIENERQSAGIVVGVIDQHGSRVVAYGGPGALDGDTIFEIGSLTKVFTALLLADMAERSELALSDSISKFVPVKSSITLEDLATHYSGLPRSPANVTLAGYTAHMLFESVPPQVTPHWEYSNFGYGLLGQAISPDYDKTLRARITGPLDMPSTQIALSPAEKLRSTSGHDSALAPAPPSDFGVLAAAAGLHSTANDLLKLLAAFLGYNQTPLAPAMDAMLRIRRSTPTPGLVNALGWQISTPDGFQIVWKDGTTPGYSSFFGYNLSARTGVVVLSNASTPRGVNDIGMYILDASSQLFRRVK